MYKTKPKTAAELYDELGAAIDALSLQPFDYEIDEYDYSDEIIEEIS